MFPEYILGYDLKDCGINEKVKTGVLLEIAEQCGDDIEAVKAEAKRRIAELVPKHITKDDIFSSINYLVCLSHDIGTTDDIDHLGNRRLRSVGELLQNQFRIGFSRMDKIVKERMNIQDQRNAHARGSYQHTSRRDRDKRVLRLFSAVPVHGSDQPAG